MKTKSYSHILIILALLSGCTKKDGVIFPPEICGMRVRDNYSAFLTEKEPVPVFRVSRNASFMLDNTDSADEKTCTFEITGWGVSPENIFFRFGKLYSERRKVISTGKERVRVTYRIPARSYGIVSVQNRLTAPENPRRCEHNGLFVEVEGGVFLRHADCAGYIRSLGPATQVHIKNSSDDPQCVYLTVENTSEKLSEAVMRGSGPREVTLSRSGKLAVILNGVVHPGEEIWLDLLPRTLTHPFSFVFGGDVKERLDTFLQLMKQVRQKADPLFMVAVGDYTRNSLPAELEEFFERTKDIPFPIYYVKGNHETRCQGDVLYRTFFGAERYHFSVEQILFVVLDSNAYDKEGYRLGEEQLRWCDKTLGAHAEAPWKFLVLHAPPHPLHGPYQPATYNSNLNEQDARSLKSLAKKHNVSYVLSGHAHLYARGTEDGVVYLTSGGGGAYLRAHNPVPGLSISTEKHLMLFHVGEDSIEEERITLP